MRLPIRVLEPQHPHRTVVLLHGAPSSPDDLVPLAKRLAVAHRVLIPTLPGYLGTPSLQPYSLDRLHALLEDALAPKGPLALVGFSLGAFHALSLAARSKLPIQAVASLGGFAGLQPEERQGLMGFVPTLRSLTDAKDPGLRAMFRARMVSAGHLAKHPEDGDRAEAWLDLVPPAVLADELEAAANLTDLYDALARRPGLRILARVGALDPAAPPVMSERLVKAAPNAELQVVPHAGHALMFEDLDGTAGALVRFLDR